MHRTVISVGVLLGAMNPMFAQNSMNTSSIEQKVQSIKSIELDYLDAVKQNDLPFFEKHISAQYIGTDNKGIVSDSSALLFARKNKSVVVNRFNVVNQSIRITGNTATVSECLTLDITKNKEHITGDFQISRVWQMEGSEWRVLMFQSTQRSVPCKA